MKAIKTIGQLNDQNRQEILNLSTSCNLSFEMAQILYFRNITTPQKVKEFLNPSKKQFHSPFKLKGMAQLVERVTIAKEQGETVLVYGDYDADGISAVSTLYPALKRFGVQAFYAIPERAEGYGLSLEVLERAVDEYMQEGGEYPSLIITVDCGVSDKDIIEEIKNLGIDVIVTDHHEIPDELPDCVVVNPKLTDQEYPFNGLCGAAVAYKVAKALIGDSADEYLDFAAVATVADSMPLIEENRAIVAEGLKIFNSRKIRKQFEALLGSATKKQITASTLAYAISPRINAAGRMGNANVGLQLFMADNESDIFEFAVQLGVYNTERQTECDKLYKSAKMQINKTGAYGGAVIVADEEWQTGLVGITAAKLMEEYSRPTIVFAGGKDGVYKGSARSLEGVNIFQALSQFKHLLVEFGGHAQAAGVAVSKENYPAFKQAFCEYIENTYTPDIFQSTVSVELCLDKPLTIDLAKELELLEPCGTANRKPLLLTTCDNVEVGVLKTGSPHVTFKTDVCEMLWFNADKYIPELLTPFNKAVVFESNISVFNGRESLKGLVKEVVITNDIPQNTAFEGSVYGNIRTVANGDTFSYKNKPIADIESLVKRRYGVVFIAYNLQTLEKYNQLKGLGVDYYQPTDSSLKSRVVISPYDFAPFEDYKAFVFLDRPIGDFPILYGKEIYLTEGQTDYSIMANTDTGREAMVTAFNHIKQLEGRFVEGAFSAYYSVGKPMDINTFTLAFETFKELGFIYIDNGVLRLDKSVKAPLDNARIYTLFKKERAC